MDLNVLLLIAYVLLALVTSFACSIAEAVLLSITPSYIEGIRDEKPDLSALLKKLRLNQVDQSLAAILTLNTIAHTVGAIGAGAQAVLVFGNAWVGVVSAVMTLLILFVSEIIPKTIGAVHWKGLAGVTARFVRILILILYPLVWVSERLTRLFSGDKETSIFNRQEFLAMARVGEQSGQIEDREFRILRNLFRFSSLSIADIMTPRTVISAVQKDQIVSEALDKVSKTPFSRFPLYGRDIDDIVGLVLKDDILLMSAQDKDDMPLEELRRDILYVPFNVSLPVLLEKLLDNRQHIVMVVDEYGATMGLVTLEDLVETLLGLEIMDEADKVADLQALAREQWKRRARSYGWEDGDA